jgi:hypothetical protein
MRVSTDKSDPGFTGPLGIQITLNSEPVIRVITADEELGLVIVHKQDSEGNLMFDPATKEIEREELRGVVRIGLSAGHRLRQHWNLKKQRTEHEFDDDAACIHCGFDGAEWHHWKHNTYEGKAHPETKMPPCTRA